MRRVVPSRQLLNYLQCAIDGQQKRMFVDSVVKTPGIGTMNNNSNINTTPRNVGVKYKINISKKSVKTNSNVVGNEPEVQFASQCYFNRRVKRLVENGEYKELKNTLQRAQSKHLIIGKKLSQSLIKRLVQGKQWSLALRVFLNYFEPTGSKHSQTIENAIVCASKAHDHVECERIYNKYLDIGYSLPVHHLLLKSYIINLEITTAREILHQLDRDNIATEETLQVYLQTISTTRIANNADELINEFEHWREVKRNQLSASTYAVFLENLMLLDLNKFESIRQAIVGKFSKSVAIYHVLLQYALLKQDEKSVVYWINKIGKKRQVLEKRPFTVVMKQFANQGDIEALGFATGALTKAGFELDLEAMNAVGEGLLKKDSLFNISKFIENMENIDKNTKKLLKKSLMPIVVNKQGLEKRFNGSSTDTLIEHVLKKINKLGDEGRGDETVEILRDFDHHGVKPPKVVYTAILRALFKNKLLNSMHEVCDLMLINGFELDKSIELLLLRASLDSKTNIEKLNEFLNSTPINELSIKDLTTVAWEYEQIGDYKQAAFLLDSKREAGSMIITCQTHDSISLYLLIRCHRKANNIDAVIDTVKLLLNGAGQPTIPIDRGFFKEMYSCLWHCQYSKQHDYALELWSQISQCKEYRQRIIERVETDIRRVYSKHR